MRKVAVVWGYFTKNLGDDLMLTAFLNTAKGKYKKIYIISYKEYSEYYSAMGVSVVAINSFTYRALNKFLYLFNKPGVYYHYTHIRKADFIMLGGSLFAESDEYSESQKQIDSLSYAVDKASKAFIIGCNFGPYKTNKFMNYYSALFGNCVDVCFRDKPSYNLFSHKSNVRYAPDIILSGIWNKSIRNESPSSSSSIVISVINLAKRKDLKCFVDDYEKLMAEIAIFHSNRGERVVLCAFCKFEGDLETCRRIRAMCNNKDIEIAAYNDLNFLPLIANARKIYGTRFHSIILAMYYSIPCVPFIYSKKTYDALCSYDVTFDCVDIRSLSAYSFKDIVEVYNVDNIDTSIRETAKNQFLGVKSCF